MKKEDILRLLRRVFHVGLLTLCLGLSTCSTTHEISAIILDTHDRPIEGALFYAEAYTHRSGTFDFACAQAGSAGEVPPSGKGPLKIQWRSRARLALAAFASGKKPVVVYDPLGRVKADGIVFRLEDLPEKGARWEPRVAQLAFPFEDNPELAERIAAPEYRELRELFWAAYAPLLKGEESALSREWVKLKALENLVGAASQGP